MKLQLWAVFIKSRRSEWMHPETVSRTRRDSWKKYSDYNGVEYSRRDRIKGRARCVKVIVEEIK